MAARSGLRLGKVTSGGPDPEGEVRVLVALSDAPGAPVWARVAQLNGSSGSSAFPQAGDEVVVGMIGADPGEPVVLGSLYSRERPPESHPAEAQAAVGRAPVPIDFDDSKQALSIAASAGLTVRQDDATGQITLTDRHHNSIAMGRDGIAISSAGELRLEAKGKLSLSAVDIQAVALASASLQGRAQAKLTSSSVVTVQGALVKIN